MSDFSVAAADMQDEINRGGLHELWQGLIAGDLEKAAKAYASDAVMHVPQDGRTLVGRAEIVARGLVQPGEVVLTVNRVVGDGQLWVSECQTHLHRQKMLLVSVAEMDNGLILREARYRALVSAARRGRTG